MTEADRLVRQLDRHRQLGTAPTLNQRHLPDLEEYS